MSITLPFIHKDPKISKDTGSAFGSLVLFAYLTADAML